MARTVNCIKLGRETEGFDFPPYPGELGKRIFENVSKEAWKQWLAEQEKLGDGKQRNLAAERPHERQDATTNRNQAAPKVADAGNLIRRRQDLPAALRVPAGLFAFRRSARPRPGAGSAAGGKKTRGDHPYRAGGQLRHSAHLLRRPRHRDLLMGPAVRLWPATGADVAALSQAPRRGRGEPRAGPGAFRAAAEIKIAELCCPRLRQFPRQVR